MRAILQDSQWLQAIGLSFIIALMSTLLAMVLALFAALALVRCRFVVKSLVCALIVLPMIVPNVIVALTLFFFFSELALFNSFTRIVIGHALIALPIATIILSSTLQGMDYRLEQAAMSLGGQPLQRITTHHAAACRTGYVLGSDFLVSQFV
ncbi:ABC transporter permease [Candidatus Symbiopectobacterium sp. 'North America']|uniref:ABC transporter permease n=1 Tax=Candidatus Symbiopectobacterium sp. 'North America' TaxID=2794574 RepID=UPI0024574908|nr:ABC transporter permease subunit [Candidatus Symbiopectobacterium sp. 'North America']